MNKAYSALAQVYESLITDDEYRAWADYVVQKLNTETFGKKGVDCASGSGFFTRALKRGGFNVSGMDLSQEMLTEAISLSAKEGLSIQFRQGDMSTFKSFEKLDFITVINDGVNYLPPKKLEKAFKAFYNSLKIGGVLFFDFSSEYKLRNVIANNMFGEDADDCSYLWFNSLKENSIEMDLSVFIKEGDKYVKKEEEHVQYIYTLDDMVKMLEKCGYKSIIAENHMGGEVRDNSLRIQITAKK